MAKIITCNANGIRAAARKGLFDWLAREQADIVCIQETKVVDELFPAEPLENLGYHPVFRGQKSYNGVAVMAKEEPEDVRFGFDDGGPADETRFVQCRVGEVTVVNTYVPQGREIFPLLTVRENLQTGLFDDDIAALVTHLNTTYYKFPR